MQFSMFIIYYYITYTEYWVPMTWLGVGRQRPSGLEDRPFFLLPRRADENTLHDDRGP
jgi:hypothetical protein